MDVTTQTWAITIAAIAALIALDFAVSRKPHEVSLREAGIWSAVYVAAALGFAAWTWVTYGQQSGTEFLGAYLVEKTLSVDNLFVFAIILSQFAVPRQYQQRVLMFGVVGALLMRAAFIAVGAAALQAFTFTFVIFGAVLIWTGVKLAKHRNEDPDPMNSRTVRLMRRSIPFTDAYHGTKLVITEEGKRKATPLLMVFAAIAATDILFALDSIPATFGITTQPYLVFTANAFALLGLRALYFLIGGLLNRLVYLSLGLSVILVFIGVKLVLAWGHSVNDDIPHVPTYASLAVIVTILTVTAVASLVRSRKDPDLVAHAGRLSSPEERDSDPAP